MRIYQILPLAMLLLCGCSDRTDFQKERREITERVTRKSDATPLLLPSPIKRSRPLYPWDGAHVGGHPKITRDFFRCKGSALNPPVIVEEEKCYDCYGSEKHSLILKKGEEFVYPILIDLLNHIQAQTGFRVIITSGHRCPTHNTYIDPTKSNRYSKHQVGAEVSFYVQGMEEEPEKVVEILMDYYSNDSNKSLKMFDRYLKEDTNVCTAPWYNNEVFIKIFQNDEGRNLDNLHPYPYIAIQVKWDRDTETRVTYNWDDAFKGLLRW